MEQKISDYILNVSKRLKTDQETQNSIIHEVLLAYENHTPVTEIEQRYGNSTELANQRNKAYKRSAAFLWNIIKRSLLLASVLFFVLASCSCTVYFIMDRLLYPGADLSHGPTSILLQGGGFFVSYPLGSAGKAALIFAVCLIICLLAYFLLVLVPGLKRHRG